MVYLRCIAVAVALYGAVYVATGNLVWLNALWAAWVIWRWAPELD